jgi:hypothetical protein
LKKRPHDAGELIVSLVDLVLLSKEFSLSASPPHQRRT